MQNRISDPVIDLIKAGGAVVAQISCLDWCGSLLAGPADFRGVSGQIYQDIDLIAQDLRQAGLIRLSAFTQWSAFC